jgi:DNA-binding NarL/FixJ family response regulator
MPDPHTPLRIALVGGHQLTRFGLRVTLEVQSDFEVVAEAGTPEEAVVGAERADVVVLDTVHPCKQACAITCALRRAQPDAAVLIVANRICSCTYRVFSAGASGVVLKDARPEQLAGAIRSVSAGYAVLPSSMAGLLHPEPAAQRSRPPEVPVATPRAAGKLATLTSRERDVLRCLALGASNAETAQRLHLSEGTVKSHVQHLLCKLGARDRVHAVIYAYESGFAVPGSEPALESRPERLRVAQAV